MRRLSRPDTIALLVAGAFFMENLDGTVIATALPAMARSFGSTPTTLAIGMTAYLLTLAVGIPASGWIADRWGARPVFAAATALFALASLLCAASVDPVSFTFARVLQGAAGAMMVPVGRLVVLRGTAKRDLVRAIATLTWPALVAPVIGPPVGGFITAALSWRWIFIINVPLGVLGCVLALRLFPPPETETRRPFDVSGFLLNGGSLAALLFALDRFGQAGAAPGLAGAVLAGSLVLGALAVRHARRSPNPLVGLAAFRIPSFAIALNGGSGARVAISTMPFLLPLLFQVGLGLGPGQAGLYVLWYGLANIGIKPATGPILRAFGFKRVLLVNGALSAMAIAACAAIGPNTPAALTGMLLMVAGASRSMQFTALNTLAYADVPPPEANAANTLFNMAFQLSIGLGIAAGAILLRVLDATLGTAPPALPFQVAFLLIGAAGLLPLIAFSRLDRAAGALVSGHKA